MIPTSFKDEKWAKRIRHLGDEAEAVYEMDRESASPARIPFIRSGLNRPPFHVARLPMVERFRPDYIEVIEQGSRYVEVQGIGRDQTIKIKDIKWQTMLKWAEFAEVDVILFVWNNVTRQVAEVDMDTLARLILQAQVDGHTGVFDERNLYFEIDWKDLSGESARPPRTARAAARASRGNHSPLGRGGVSGTSVRTGRARGRRTTAEQAAGDRGDGVAEGAQQGRDGKDATQGPQGDSTLGRAREDEAPQGA